MNGGTQWYMPTNNNTTTGAVV